jgi:hypothetical protein
MFTSKLIRCASLTVGALLLAGGSALAGITAGSVNVAGAIPSDSHVVFGEVIPSESHVVFGDVIPGNSHVVFGDVVPGH